MENFYFLLYKCYVISSSQKIKLIFYDCDMGIRLILNALNSYFDIILDKTLDQITKSKEDSIFKFFFQFDDESFLLSTPDPLFKYQKEILKTKESVVQLSLTNQTINGLLIDILSIKTISEKYTHPFLIFLKISSDTDF